MCVGGRGSYPRRQRESDGRKGWRKRTLVGTYRRKSQIYHRRLLKIRPSRNKARQEVRRNHHGPAEFRQRSQRRNVENRGQSVFAHQGNERSFVGQSAFYLLNSYTTGLQPTVMANMLKLGLNTSKNAVITADEIGLNTREEGIVLPAGASALAIF